MTDIETYRNRRERWFSALESSGWKQGKEFLHFHSPIEGDSYCVLGVACELAPHDVLRLHKVPLLQMSCDTAHAWRSPDTEEDYLRVAPPAVIEYYGLSGSGHCRLWTTNDKGMTFAQLAADMRADPSKYFERGTY